MCGTVDNSMSKQYFYGWSWDTSDLIQCKNALVGLLNEGHNVSELIEMDFGNLDTLSIIDEYNECQLNAYEAEHC